MIDGYNEMFFEKYGGDMNFEFSDDQLVMKEEVRKLLKKKIP